MAVSENAADLSANGVALAIGQPDSPTSPLTASSYLRLGAYTPSGPNGRSEADLVTQVSLTAAPGPDDHGVLLYTNHDLQQNVLGAGRMRYGQGLAVKVLTGNTGLSVDDGQYDLFAKRDIAITAGDASTPSDIVITAQGNVRIVSKGDMSHVTQGNSAQIATGDVEKTTEGNVKETTYGTRSGLTLGEDFDFCLGSRTSVSLPLVTNIAVAYRIDIVSSLYLKLFTGANISYTFGWKNDYVNGAYRLSVMGAATIASSGKLKLSAGSVDINTPGVLSIEALQWYILGSNVTAVASEKFEKVEILNQSFATKIFEAKYKAENADTSYVDASVAEENAKVASKRIEFGRVTTKNFSVI